jgi:aspartyl-tRNA(Asn)/glutamyl-tRNA(Gln) amidotransferase subunit C
MNLSVRDFADRFSDLNRVLELYCTRPKTWILAWSKFQVSGRVQYIIYYRTCMADFDKGTLEHLKRLSRIECDEDEEKDILWSLKRVLEYVAQLDEVKTEKTKPCNSVLNGMAKNRWREDVPEALLSREQFLVNAPDQIAGMIRVPPVLKPQ